MKWNSHMVWISAHILNWVKNFKIVVPDLFTNIYLVESFVRIIEFCVYWQTGSTRVWIVWSVINSPNSSSLTTKMFRLHWRHNDHDGVSNHQPHGCFLNRLFRQIKENTKAPRRWPLCGEFTGTAEFPAQRASYAENVSIWWRHHEKEEGGSGQNGWKGQCSSITLIKRKPIQDNPRVTKWQLHWVHNYILQEVRSFSKIRHKSCPTTLTFYCVRLPVNVINLLVFYH